MDSVPDITANIRTLKSEQPQLTAREIHAAIEAKHGEGTLTLAETKKWCAKITKQRAREGEATVKAQDEEIESKEKQARGEPSLCAGCGERQKGMSRCTRCMQVWYCGRECQKKHWKQHKPQCRMLSAYSGLPSGVKPELPAPQERLLPEFGMRPVIVSDPAIEKIECTCFCCGMLTPKEGNRRLLVSEKGLSSFGEIYAPHLSSSVLCEKYNGLIPYPSEFLMQSLSKQQHLRHDQTIHRYESVESDGTRTAFLGACQWCATALQNDKKGKFLSAWSHQLALTETLGEPLDITRFGQPEITLAERRAASLLSLYTEPDLTKGNKSIAGRFNDGAGERRGTKVTFEYQALEMIAFPLLFMKGQGGWTKNCGVDLEHYTWSRLYSVSPQWRNDPDYVLFSLHRLTALLGTGHDILAMLPPATYHNFEDMKYAVISLPPFGRGT